MSGNLWSKVTYTAPIDYIINSKIVEYDMSKANINILLYYGLISPSQYQEFYEMSKRRREISIGLLQRKDKKYVDALKKGFIEFKRKFFEANDIEDHSIVSIKNDAVFVVNKIIHQTKFDTIEFKPKNVYNAFYKLGRLEAYYSYNFYTKFEKLDLKNIDKHKVKYHDEYMINFLKCLFNSAEVDPITETISIIKDFYSMYMNRELEVQYYREFNTTSMYSYMPIPGIESVYKTDFVIPEDAKYLDISYNEWLIRHLYGIFINIYIQSLK